MMKSGTTDQKPMTLCQLKSRAFEGRRRLNHSTLRNCTQFHLRGNQR